MLNKLKAVILMMTLALMMPMLASADVITTIPRAPLVINTTTHTCLSGCPTDVVGPAVMASFATLLVTLALEDKVQPCDNEPVRRVRHPGSNYSFDVAGCDYEAKKASLVLLK